jgi:uncharacterized membrane protein
MILAMLAAGLWAMQRLPSDAAIAVHFDAAGHPNNWMHPWPGLFVLPGIAAGVFVLIAGLSRIDPLRANIARSGSAFGTLILAPVAVIAIAQAAIIETALGRDINVSQLMFGAMGGLFIVIGNVMGKLRPNRIAGIRTPWTLADDRVWDKTHRFGGRLFVAGGMIVVLAALTTSAGARLAMVVLVVIAACTALTVIKSYLLWRERPGTDG